MTISEIDPKTAVIVVDLQKGIATPDRKLAHPIDGVVARSAELAAAFRKHGQTVVLVNVTGGAPGRNDAGARITEFPPDFAELMPELDAQPDDVLITKRTWGSFHGTGLHEALQERGVTQVVVTGVATSAGVESTARSAHEHGYHVVLAVDAMTDMSAEAHQNSVERIFPRMAETATTAEILALLDGS